LYWAIAAPPPDSGEAYSFFGRVVTGTEVLSSLTLSDTIESVTIEVK
jgi:hypothetical protein